MVGLVVHEMKPGNPRHLTIVDGIPTMGPELTLLHLGAVCSPNTVEMALEAALHSGLTTREMCWRVLRRYARQGRPGVTTFREVLKRRDPSTRPTQSAMETLVLQMCRAYALPAPITQYELRRDDGTVIATLDKAWPDSTFGLEYQSLKHHSRADEKARDRRRVNGARGVGWDVMEVGPDDVTHYAAQTAAAIRAGLKRGARTGLGAAE